MHITSCFARDLFQGKTVFITGGGSGINLGIARNFAAVGARLGLRGRARDTLDTATARPVERVSGVAAGVLDHWRAGDRRRWANLLGSGAWTQLIAAEMAKAE
jgi:NAD(P)-dependent dehydrogenase (short-subunit alcohol dehydrogenase family)